MGQYVRSRIEYSGTEQNSEKKTLKLSSRLAENGLETLAITRKRVRLCGLFREHNNEPAWRNVNRFLLPPIYLKLDRGNSKLI